MMHDLHMIVTVVYYKCLERLFMVFQIFAPLRTDTNNKLSSEEKAFPVRLEKAAK
jgi:hypothetical protein